MEPDPKDWLDIPDPLAAPSHKTGRAPAAPALASPTRGDMKKRRLVALVGSLAWVGVALAIVGFRHELGEHAGLVAGQTFLWSALFVAVLVLALGKGPRGLGAPVDRARGLTIAVPVAFIVAGLCWLPASAATFGEIGPFSNVVGCFIVGIAVVVPLVALLVWSVRRSFPSAAGWRGALLGAASGLGAALVLTLHCASPLGGHVVLAHGMPLILAALAGGWLGSRVARS
jgi:hypothetical protein